MDLDQFLLTGFTILQAFLLPARATGASVSAGGVCGRHGGLDAEAPGLGRRLPALQAQRVLDQDQEARAPPC